jgi:hypothetical protein
VGWAPFGVDDGWAWLQESKGLKEGKTRQIKRAPRETGENYRQAK